MTKCSIYLDIYLEGTSYPDMHNITKNVHISQFARLFDVAIGNIIHQWEEVKR